MIKIGITGVCGKMGRLIASLVPKELDMKLTGAIEAKGHPSIGVDISTEVGLKEYPLIVEDDLESCIDKLDVVIEFTNPKATIENLTIATNYRKKMVIGTTGLSSNQESILKEASQKTAIVYAPNMSVGVNLLYKLIQEATSILKDDFDIEIVEAHHRFKKDAPSGTACKILEIISKELGRSIEELSVYGRYGEGIREKDTVGVFAVRAGDIAGEHRIIFGGMGETIEIIHRAQSREIFARGAIKAARFIAHKEKGLFSMQHVLGFE
jgi:4-hydroxy-tetrahydrodipicolinate reductase